MYIYKKIIVALITIGFIGNFAHASNCSDFNLWDAVNNNWTNYGNVFSFGALFEPEFTGGLAATYVANSGSTAYYTFPASVTVASSDTPAYYTLLKGGGVWNNEILEEGAKPYIWIGVGGDMIQYANKTGQNCDATVSLIPVSGTTYQNIGGVLMTVGLNDGRKITAMGHASTVTPMTTPQNPYININMSLAGMVLNLSTSGYVTITVPHGTPDGDYTGTIAMPYTVSACAGQVVCQDPRLLVHMKTGVSNIKATIRIRVVDGRPVNPKSYCHASSGSNISIQHGTLTPGIVNGNIKSNTITISCTGGAMVPVKIKLAPVGQPNTSSQYVGNKGILTPMSNGIDSLVTLDNGLSEKTINVNSTAAVKVNSELKTGSRAVIAGSFSGSAIATISYN